MKITVLVENTVCTGKSEPLLGQHGLAFLLDVENCGKILFDTGQSDILTHNMILLDVLADNVDYVVLSHGHDDHSGGLLSFLRSRTLPVTVFAGPGIFSARYVERLGGKLSYIGIACAKELLVSQGAEFVFVYGPSQINENIWLSGPIPKVTEYEKESLNLLDANKQTDRFADEVALFYVKPEGLVVITGCAHRGIVNIIKYGQRVTGVSKLYAVIGGSHLENMSDEQKEDTMKFLEEEDPKIIALNHCTGTNVQATLRNRFGDKFVTANTGMVLDI